MLSISKHSCFAFSKGQWADFEIVVLFLTQVLMILNKDYIGVITMHLQSNCIREPPAIKESHERRECDFGLLQVAAFDKLLS